MADSTLGRLLSIRRKRGSRGSRGSFDTDVDNSSFGSDDVTPARGRSIASRKYEPLDTQSRDAGSTHGITFNVPDEKEGGEVADDTSPLSYELEDPELSSERPPAVSIHPSQIGYLTTNSSIIQAKYHQGSQSSQYSTTTDNLEESDPTASTDASGLVPPVSQPGRRSPSPAARLRDVFRSKQRSSRLSAGGSATSSPERQPTVADPRLSTDTIDAPNLTDPPKAYSTSDADTGPKNVSIEENTVQEEQHPSAERFSRLSRGQHISTTTTPPGSPGGSENGTPVIVNTPPTPTHAEQPNLRSPRRINGLADAVHSQRRGRSGSASLVPSKLATIASSPLTPTLESDIPTPLNSSPGFFGSVLSAAQNAFTNSIPNTNVGPGQARNRGSVSTQDRQENQPEDDKVEVEPSAEATSNAMESKEPAVKTLGTGDLSLSQLGIEPVSRAPTPVKLNFPDSSVSRSRSESAPPEATPVKTSLEAPWDDAQRPRTSYEQPPNGDKTPPPGSLNEDSTSINRSGSIRSALSRVNRKRGSTNGTGGTGNTVSAAIAAANGALAGATANQNAPKLTGFAVASKKRNRDFHVLFKSVPDDDYLIEDYSCALQREILAHGRLRDSTYDLIVKIWKLGHPGLQSSLNGVRLDETGGDKTEKIDAESVVGDSRSASASDEEDEESDDGEEVYDEDEEEEEGDVAPAVNQTAEAPLLESALEKSISRKPSGNINGSVPADKPKDAPAAPSAQDFQGPATHAPTDCGDSDTHYKKIVGDDIVPAPLGKVYDLLFGASSAAWMGKWLTGDQKCTDLQMEDKRGLALDNRTRNFSYIKPLGGSIGPKQTKCIVTENLENLDLEKAVNILVSTQNPDVPSGNVFSVKTKYCLSWAENNATRPIENGANEGQTQYCKDLFASLKAAVSSKPRAAPATNGAPKGKKRGKKGKSEKAANVASDTEAEVSKKASAKPSDWGILEPVHGILGPVLDIAQPLLTGNVVYILLAFLLITAWFSFGSSKRPVARPYGSELAFISQPDRLAAYEEMWRREESELWEWLEERVGMDRLNSGELHTRKKVLQPRTVEERLREEHMDEREIKEAIRITEEKLHVLKSVVDKRDHL
ncbi:hypothetical protein SLS53_000903 [Cytospora paraplurivora]|uniref:VASt domain-containing protein n=1 Tax=Cytospora paraplurivora TaxID=2898453 RepID=A0AAN9YNL8_9PEZI